MVEVSLLLLGSFQASYCFREVSIKLNPLFMKTIHAITKCILFLLSARRWSGLA